MQVRRFPSLFAIAVLPYAYGLGGPATSNGPIDCYRAARGDLLSEQEAVHLCEGSVSRAPADCFHSAQSELSLSQSQRIELCRCTDSLAPLYCFDQARSELTLSAEQRLALCAPVRLYPSYACVYGTDPGLHPHG